MHTERFRQLRSGFLKTILNVKDASSLWRSTVRSQLRSADIVDLYDHYDFNYNIEERVKSLQNDILDGSYTTSAPLIYRMEKKFGVCRHMVIPQPRDALLLQALIEQVHNDVISAQPSKNAYYSRDKHIKKKLHEGVEYGVSFHKQWKSLQKNIYKFNDEKELLVVTDVSNYFDSIDLLELRKIFVSLIKANEVLVDVLFKVIEGISWTPDYLPYSKRGLPTANFESIRLLAHSFLFEIDEVLKNETSESFVRWMDDITIGVDSRKEAISLLSSISDMLKSRGLALNLSKTAIYDTAETKFHFQIDQNIYLDSLEPLTANMPSKAKLEKELIKRFKEHFKSCNARYAEKITKRFITAFGRLESKELLDLLPRLYLDNPNIRSNILYYLENIGFSWRAADAIKDILRNLDIFDDLSLFQICRLLTNWRIPQTIKGKELIKFYDQKITNLGIKTNETSGFYSVIWFKAKYSKNLDLLSFIWNYRKKWTANALLNRQATVCVSRLLNLKDKKPKIILQMALSSGMTETVSIASQIYAFSKQSSLESRLNLYLFPTRTQKSYRLEKFLVLCSVLNSKDFQKDKDLLNKIRQHITDPTYLKILKADYKIVL